MIAGSCRSPYMLNWAKIGRLCLDVTWCRASGCSMEMNFIDVVARSQLREMTGGLRCSMVSLSVDLSPYVEPWIARSLAVVPWDRSRK
jgi:hypothetical protein